MRFRPVSLKNHHKIPPRISGGRKTEITAILTLRFHERPSLYAFRVSLLFTQTTPPNAIVKHPQSQFAGNNKIAW